MKTSAIIVAATAALASAQALPEGTNSVNCAKPNANYCLGGDIIIRCDANQVGTAGRCSDNVAGEPPLGGVAECYQSSETAGDAACQKNCVVYAQPSFTLAADQCTPSAPLATGTAVAQTTAAQTGAATSAAATSAAETTGAGTSVADTTGAGTSVAETSAPAATGTVVYTTTVVNGTVTITVPCTTVATSVTGVVPPPITPSSVVSVTGVVPPPITPSSVVTPPSGTGVPPPPPAGGNQTAPNGSNTPVGPTSTGGGAPPAVPTNAAVANRATGALAVMGLVAAYFL